MRRELRRKEQYMYYHSQDLKKEDNTKDLVYWRCWIGNKPQLTIDVNVPSKHWHINFDLCENGWQEEAIGFSIACPLIALWVGLESRWLYKKLESLTKRTDQKYTNGRTIGLSYHSGSFWFSLWEDPMESRSVDPKWWHFTFTPMDLLFGKQKHNLEVFDEGKTTINMPEGNYDATYKIEKRTWTRSRFPLFKKTRTSVYFNIPVGIPHEGKGENSWDMGMDATFGTGTEWHGDLHEARKKIAISCLETRAKYGSLNSPDYLKWKLEGEVKLAHKHI